MSNNNIDGLNKFLFEQLNRLNDASLQGDALQKEIERSKAISSVSKDLIASTRLALEARQHIDQNKMHKTLPTCLAIGPEVTK